ncbi:tetratricopeptide repeat protein [Fulvivirgaceae bacterium BMA10]|uniref:Tetratricopeptide repeat protein n=1 Tax=Splendidivirga corallicola TaxID=3051826 RepID=A0ABT8KZ62_9BACT|nr:tetratricopeptide repeat protein [Fulvivirgaceae bacterium BMA10]
MKTLSKFFALIIGISIATLAQGQELKVNEMLYRAYLTNSKTMWEKGVGLKQEAYNKDETNTDLLLDLALAQYGLLGSTMANQDKETFKKYLDDTKENLEKVIKHDEKSAEPKAILSSVYGLEMAYSPWKGMYLGSRSGSLMEKAVKLNDRSALVLKLHAGSKLFTPKMFGGNINMAIESFKKAIDLFESEPEKLKNNWLYLDALSFLGQAYEKAGKKEEAIATYKKALEFEPEFGWVKYSLLPNVQRQ